MYFSRFALHFHSIAACQSKKKRPSVLVVATALLMGSMFGCGVAEKSVPSTDANAELSVSISEPAQNATVSSPVQIRATTNRSGLIEVLLDGVAIFKDQASSINTAVEMSAGPHDVTVRATDSNGGISNATVSVMASSSSLDDLTVLDHLEEYVWSTCGNCGNTGGSVGSTATYSMERAIAMPSVDGSSTRFSIGGPYPYTNAYWYLRHSAPTVPISYLKYEFDLYIPAGMESAPQAIEFECQQRVGGYIYNFAWQAEYPKKLWRIFDYVERRWDETGLSFVPFTPNTWHHIVAEYHTAEHSVVHDALTVDGVRYSIGMKHPAKFVGDSSNSLTNGFQLDLNKVPTAYAVYVDGMKVSYK